MEAYIKNRLLSVSPVPCKFKVGDVVTYTNSNEVVFEDNKVIGFSGEDSDSFQYGKFIHLDNSCYWSPVHPESLQFKGQERPVVDRDLVLNNGQKAVYSHTDWWSRPNYVLESGRKVCCIDLNGTNLHTMSKDGEPCFPLKEEFQPKRERGVK